MIILGFKKMSNKIKEELKIGPGSASIDPSPEVETPPAKSINIVKKAKKMKTNEGKDLLGKPTPSAKQIADKHGMPLKAVHKQIAKGAKIEREHTNSHDQAAEIARDHVNEFPNYYNKLKKFEAGLKKTKTFKEFKEEAAVVNSVGAGNIAGMPPVDTVPPVPKGVTTRGKLLRRKKPIGNENTK